MNTILFFLPFIIIFVVLAVYAERKVSAFIQGRYGPMEVGKYGLLQTVADLLKLIQKEDIKPAAIDKKLFLVAPVLIFVFVFAGFSVLPVSSVWSGSYVETGVYFLLAIVSLDVIGILLAGWGSNNKYSLYGAMRSVSQIISYEIPVAISVLTVVVISGTLNLQEISLQQSILNETPLFAIEEWGGFFTWNIVKFPLLIPVFIIYFIASLSESNRAPFDLPEAESEIVAGFQLEYAGFRWSLIMLAEYGMMLLVSILGVVLFLGSWSTPLPNIGSVALADWTTGQPGTLAALLWGIFWLVGKSLFIVFIQMWVRWTFPRLRVDQLMTLGWKYLIPAGLVLLFSTCLYFLLLI